MSDLKDALCQMSTTTKVLAGAAAAGILLAWQASRPATTAKKKPLPIGHTSVPLLDNESSHFMADIPATTAVTVFEGQVGISTDILCDRLAAIMRANPWLAGRLQQGENGLDLVYPTVCDESIASQYLHRLNAKLSHEMDFMEVAKALHDAGAYVKVGKECAGQDEPLFKLSLAEFKSKGHFALIMSLSHVIADGHTFYTIHNALSPDRAVVTLNPERKLNAHPAIDRALGGPEQALLMSAIPMGFYFFMVTRVLASLLFGPRTEFRMYTVDASFVEEQKAATKASGDVPFVSTNDVITSAVCKASGSFVAMMAVNFRGRVDEVEACDAGNYQNVILYRPEDYQNPGLIRASIQPLRRASSPATAVPSFWDFATTSTPLMNLTNWATFHQGMQLDRCKECQHFPIMKMPDFVPSYVQSNAVIFNSESGKLGLFVMGTRALHDAVRASGLVGEGPEWPALP
jgi:hypothetical protein